MEIKSHPFFSEVAEKEIGPLAEAARLFEYEAESLIFEEGSPPEGFYLVLEGEVAFRKRVPDGGYRTVSYSRKGDYFGEIGVITGHARSLRAEAGAQKTVIANIPGDALHAYLSNMPGPISKLLDSIIKHLHDTTTQYIEDMLRKEKLVVVGNMMNSILHDFKNPCCLISLGSQLMRQIHPDQRTQEICINIEEQVNRMIDMAKELGEFTRGQQDLHLTRLNMHELLRSFEDLNFPYFEEENIGVFIDMPEVIVNGEKGKLMRIFQNLVSNAIDAMPSDGGNIQISGKVDLDQQKLVITVADDGPGIPEEIRDKFWEPFVSHGKPNGTGLGTAIVRSIIEAHGGSISYATVSGEGTTFTITLPLAPEEEEVA